MRRRRDAGARHERGAQRSVRPAHRVSAHLGHGPVQLPLRVLHAARRAAVAAARGDSHVRRDRGRRRGSSRRSGLRRLRITGGEPTIRPQLDDARSRCCARCRASRTSRSRRTACGCRSWRRDLASCRTRSREHERGQPARRSHRDDRASHARLRSRATSALAAERAGLRR